MTDHVLRIMVLAGRIAQAVGKGGGASGESDYSRDWRSQMRRAADQLEAEARALRREAEARCE